MSEQVPARTTLRPSAAKRRAVSVSAELLVKTGSMQDRSPLPLLAEPAVEGVDLTTWAKSNRDFITTSLWEHGGILWRGFHITTPGDFEQFLRALCGDLLEYRYGSTPRTRISGDIYSSTEYPAGEHIPLHNEMSYTTSWPMKIGFFCALPAEEGGETPIADSRRVFARIPPRIRELFTRKGVMYVRTYGRRLDLPWQEVFLTDDRREVEAYCQRASIQVEWKGDDGLRTRQVCQAVATHPQTGEGVWFNQAHLFHTSNLRPEVRKSLLDSCPEEDLPRNTYFGDGSPIPDSLLDDVREAYARETVSFPWRRGDVLVLDNMLVAHGRTPFRGPRQILVGMAEAHSAEGVTG